MVDQNDSFMREVNEEMRRDQLRRIWQTYGVVIVAAIVTLFVGVIAYQWWQARQTAFAEQSGARYEAASKLIAETKTDEALASFADLAKTGAPGYATLAQLRLAGQHASTGRVAEALASYEAVAAGPDVQELLRDFATLQAAMLRLDQADWTEMKNRLTPITDENRPWHTPAREILGLAAYKAGQNEEATKLFEQLLGDRGATTGISRRAQDMLAILNDTAGAKKATAPAGTAETSKAAEPAKSGDADAKK